MEEKKRFSCSYNTDSSVAVEHMKKGAVADPRLFQYNMVFPLWFTDRLASGIGQAEHQPQYQW